MKLRKKLRYNLYFLFAVIVALAAMGIYCLTLLASVSTTVTTDNLRTLNYVQGMNKALARIDNILSAPGLAGLTEDLQRNFDSLSAYLDLQQKNVTEHGEGALTAQLRVYIDQFRWIVDTAIKNELPVADSIVSRGGLEMRHLLLKIHEELEGIYDLNSEIVIESNLRATQTAHDVIVYMSLFAIVGIVIGLLFTAKIPRVIFEPIYKFNYALGKAMEGDPNLTIVETSQDEIGMLTASFNRLMTRLKEFERMNLNSVLFEKQRLATIINRMNEGVIGLDTFRYVIFANDFVLGLLNLERDAIIGRYAPDVALENMLFAEILRRMEKSKDADNGESIGYLKIVVNSGERLYIESVLKPQAPDEKEGTLGHVIILTDITEFAEKDSAKTKLIGTLSHELKTPVAAIDMCIDLISNKRVGTLTDVQREYMDTIRSNTLRIRKLVADMIDLAKVESGTVDMRIEPVRTEVLVEKAVEGVRIFLDEKNISTQIDIEANLPPIAADFSKAVGVLNNLLTNGIRHSPEKSTITIMARRNGSNVTLSVSDQGSGLPDGVRDQLFDRYVRLDGETTGGTGLGLAIVKELMEAMGGSVDINSCSGHGSTFLLTFMSVPSPMEGEHVGLLDKSVGNR